MRNIKIIVEYEGTRYKGWQIQSNTALTVQSEIKKAVKRITGETVTVIGSGRTDKGVHARGQCANFRLVAAMPLPRLRLALNAVLPDDIAIVRIAAAPASFHAQYDAKYKTYRYTILNRPSRGALERRTAWYCPAALDVASMQTAARCLVGRRDFRSFQAADPARDQSNAVRHVKKITIKKSRQLIHIDIESNGFLYKMVRNIVGTLIETGRGKLPPGHMNEILK